jgi:hypothetical protein
MTGCSGRRGAPPLSLNVRPLKHTMEVGMQRVVFAVVAAVLSVVTGGLIAAENPGAEAEIAALKREYADVLALQDTAKREVLAIASILRANPEIAIDRTAESGEYCFKSGSGTMVHFAVHPDRTPEDVVYELDASGLIAAGLDPARMEPMPELGRMTPGVWYFLPKGRIDPHHGHAMGGPTIAIAVNVR